MDRRLAALVLIAILLIPIAALLLCVYQPKTPEQWTVVLPTPTPTPTPTLLWSHNLIGSTNTTISLSSFQMYGQFNYSMTITTFIPETTASASAKYQEILDTKTDKFGNKVNTYGGLDPGCFYLTRLRYFPICWYVGGYTTQNIGTADRYNDVNTTFSIPDGSLNATIMIEVTGPGSALVNLYAI